MAAETFWFWAGWVDSTTFARVGVEYDTVTLLISDVLGHNGIPGHTVTCTVFKISNGQQIYNRSIVGGAADAVVNVPGNQHMVHTSYGAIDLPDAYGYTIGWS